MEAFQIKFDDLSSKCTQLETAIDNHGTRLNNLDGLVSGLRIDMKYLKERVNNLNQTDNEIEISMQDLWEKCIQLADEVAENSSEDDKALLILINNLKSDFQTLSNQSDSKDAELQAAIEKF